MRVLIVEDHPLFQEIIQAVVAKVFAEPVIEATGSLTEAIALARRGKAPDLALLDLGLPDSAGIDTLVAFRKACPDVRVLVVSATDDPASVLRALAAGAAGYVPKTSPPPAISAALRRVADGGIYIPTQGIDAGEALRRPKRDTELTRRQAEVLRLIVRGFPNKEIAQQLRIAEDTVKQHASAAYAALGVSSRTQAVRAIARRGLSLG